MKIEHHLNCISLMGNKRTKKNIAEQFIVIEIDLIALKRVDDKIIINRLTLFTNSMVSKKNSSKMFASYTLDDRRNRPTN